MSKSMLKNIAFIGFIVLFSGTAKAGIGDIMDGIFEDSMMVNSVGSQAYQGQSRGVLHGGSLRISSKIAPAPKFIAFKPPSFNAGCGGINLFGGSFSFISGEELVGYLRAIGANSVGYFFQLALNATCPTCATLIEGLQKKMQDLSAALGNSCEATKKLFETSGLKGAIEDSKFKAEMDSVLGKDGLIGGAAASANDFFGFQKTNSSPKASSAKTGVPYDSNIVFKQLKESAFEDMVAGPYLTSTGTGTLPITELAMSLYGTVVFGEKEWIDNNECENELCTTAYPPLLTSDDITKFITGDKNNPLGYAKINVYKCDEYEKCLSPSSDGPGTVIEIKPFKKYVEELLIGFPDPSTGNYVDGLVYYIAERKTIMPAELEAFVSNMSEPMLKMLNDLSGRPGSAQTFAAKYAEQIAIDFAFNFFQKLSSASFKAISKSNDEAMKKYAGEANSRIIKALSLIASQYEIKASGSEAFWVEYDLRLKSIQRSLARTNSIPISTSSR